MKKLIGVITLFTLLLTLTAVPALAEDIQTPWNNSNIKVNVFGTFAGLADETINFHKTGAAYDNAHIQWASGNLNEFEFQIKDEQLTLSLNETGSFISDVQFTGMLPETVTPTGIEGFGIYIKNNNTDTYTEAVQMFFQPIIYGSDWAMPSLNGKGILVDKATKTATEIDSIYQCFAIPSGFEGYLLIAADAFTSSWADTPHALRETDNLGGVLGLKIGGVAITGANNGLTIDNLFYYGTGVTEANADLIEVGASSPTTEPTDGSQNTADISTIAYALAAITGCGALVIKKRK